MNQNIIDFLLSVEVIMRTILLHSEPTGGHHDMNSEEAVTEPDKKKRVIYGSGPMHEIAEAVSVQIYDERAWSERKVAWRCFFI